LFVAKKLGAELMSEGLDELKKKLEKAKSMGGATIFVDETYQLSPQDNQQGRQILDYILPRAESLKGDFGSLVWIVAGYPKLMDKLFESNPGLPSRFPLHVKFQDFTDEELQDIFMDYLKHDGQMPSTKPKKASQPNASLSPAARSQQSRRNQNASFPYNYPNSGMGLYNAVQAQGALSDGDTNVDQHNNIWTFRYSRKVNKLTSHTHWWDENDNRVQHPLSAGQPHDPLISDDEDAWTWNGSSWRSSGGKISKNVPEKPKEVKPSSQPYTADPKYVRITIRRLGRGRDRDGFGNARAVRNLYETVRKRQAARIIQEQQTGRQPDIFRFERDDLLGPRLTKESLANCKALQELKGMIGLDEVKKSMDELMVALVQIAEREEKEETTIGMLLNRVFVGNPGTGKTTVAELYGKILCHFGLLSKGEVVLKAPSDFIGSVLGSSEKQARDILRAAEGCVLVIDEAYSLTPTPGSSDPYKTAVIDTLVEQIQAKPGDDRAVILLGYRDKMEAMFRVVNPGLSRRFQWDNPVVFQDYDEMQLIAILRSKCKKDNLEISFSVARDAIKHLAKARAMPNFGNGGAVDSLATEAKKRMLSRHGASLILEDFGPAENLQVDDNIERIFAHLVGNQEILECAKILKATVHAARDCGRDPLQDVQMNYLFVGSPGTGKTTVARAFGRLLKGLTLLPTDEVVEVSASDLTTGYVGQSANRTTETFRKVRGLTKPE
jgi:SpoVK/Ycf46/Vps4 family AAA+-type ATPase